MIVKSALLLCIVALACLYSPGVSAAEEEQAVVSTSEPFKRYKRHIFDPCSLKPKTGKCKAYFPRYYYHPSSRQCKRFIYGGCGGNKNRFGSIGACQAKCGCAAVSCPRYCSSVHNPRIKRCCPHCRPSYCRRVRCYRRLIKCRPGYRLVSYKAGCCYRQHCVKRFWW